MAIIEINPLHIFVSHTHTNTTHPHSSLINHTHHQYILPDSVATALTSSLTDRLATLSPFNSLITQAHPSRREAKSYTLISTNDPTYTHYHIHLHLVNTHTALNPPPPPFTLYTPCQIASQDSLSLVCMTET